MGEVVLAPFFLEDAKGGRAEDLWPWVSRQSSRKRERERERHSVNWITSLSSLSLRIVSFALSLPFLPP